MVLDKETDVIRYLMGEMDPSEEVLMEREMMEDDDLLIEVESMRQTLHRLDDLPEKEPPEELTESIVNKAGEYRRGVRRWQIFSSNVYKYAAVLILGFGIGSGVWYMMGISGTRHTRGMRGIQQTSFTVSSPQATAKAQVKPWIDRHDILYYQDKFGNISGYRAIQQTSLHKLTPVQQPAIMSGPTTGNVHLTGEIKR